MTTRVAIVGGGAVGQVYGFHLLRGGAEVTYFVREKYVEELRAGPFMHPLRGARQPQRLEPTDVRSDMLGVGDGFDQVWLCVPSPALLSGGLDSVIGAVAASDATLVAMIPGMQVRAYLSTRIPLERVVDGMIGMIAYQAPLPGESLDPPGTAFVLPRLSPSQFSGLEPARVTAVVDGLKRGGAPAKVTNDARVALAMSSSIMMPVVVALEGAGWSFSALRRGDWLALAARAARQAMSVVAAELGAPVPGYRWLIQSGLLRIATWLAPITTPFDAETYFEYHFTKVRTQTALMLRSYRESGDRHDLETEAIGELERRVFGDIS